LFVCLFVFICLFVQENFQNNSIFSQAYGHSLAPNHKPDGSGGLPMMHQEPSLYSLFEGTPWSPSLPASSGTRAHAAAAAHRHGHRPISRR